jgi:hypothetical protein
MKVLSFDVTLEDIEDDFGPVKSAELRVRSPLWKIHHLDDLWNTIRVFHRAGYLKETTGPDIDDLYHG